MTEISAASAIGRDPISSVGQQGSEPVSHEIVDLFEHLLGEKLVQPSGVTKDTMARILANPSSLGDHILANVEGMHQTFNEFSAQIEGQLAPAGTEGMSLGGQSGSDEGGISSQLDPDAGMLPGPAESGGLQNQSDRVDSPAGWQGEMQDLLWVQYNVGRILVHEEMMSKAAGKSTQNLDMLLRGQ